MRKLMWFSIGFCVACAVSVYLLQQLLTILLGCLFLCGSISLVLLSRKARVKICAAVCLGLSLGMLWCSGYDALRLAPIRALDEKVSTFTLTAEDDSFPTDYGICVDGTAQIEGVTCKVRAYVSQTEPLHPGDRVTGKFRLRYTAPGASEDVTYHSSKGILLLAYPKGKHTVEPAPAPDGRYFAAYLRGDILKLVQEVFPEDVAPFAKALLLGDTADLDYETEHNLSDSGLRHVAAVSGLHVSILFSMFYLLTGRKRVISAVLGIPLLFVFSAVAGFSPSIVRASVMQGLLLLGNLLDKEYDSPTALASVVLVMLAINPLAVTSVGMQLSVASVAGIMLFYEKLRGWFNSLVPIPKKKRGSFPARAYTRITASISVSLSALIATTPLTVWYFGTVSLLSVVTNLLCLWVVTILFCGIVGVCLVGWIWVPAAKVLAWVVSWLARFVLGIAGVIGDIPYCAVYTESIYILAWVIASYLLLAGWFLFYKKRPMILMSAVAFLLCVAILLSWGIPLLDDYRVTVLDVGQGQCVLLQAGGKTYMVDCGGSYQEETADIAAQTLLSQGIRHLDGLILTHYDKDHVGAAKYLLQRVPADLLILPEGDKASSWDPDLLEVHEGAVLRATEDMTLSWEEGEIRIFSSWTTETSNESSLCVLFHTEKCDILITGDRSSVGEEILLNMADIPQLDALVVGHHGSGKSTGQVLLDATCPRVALISVGEDNAYDHPDPVVLERLRLIGCTVRRTDLEGTIIIRG